MRDKIKEAQIKALEAECASLKGALKLTGEQSLASASNAMDAEETIMEAMRFCEANKFIGFVRAKKLLRILRR